MEDVYSGENVVEIGNITILDHLRSTNLNLKCPARIARKFTKSSEMKTLGHIRDFIHERIHDRENISDEIVSRIIEWRKDILVDIEQGFESLFCSEYSLQDILDNDDARQRLFDHFHQDYKRLLYFFISLLIGLGYLHLCGVVHNSITLNHIFISRIIPRINEKIGGFGRAYINQDANFFDGYVNDFRTLGRSLLELNNNLYQNKRIFYDIQVKAEQLAESLVNINTFEEHDQIFYTAVNFYTPYNAEFQVERLTQWLQESNYTWKRKDVEHYFIKREDLWYETRDRNSLDDSFEIYDYEIQLGYELQLVSLSNQKIIILGSLRAMTVENGDGNELRFAFEGAWYR